MKKEPAFSAVAAGYDAAFTETAVGRLQRSLVWQQLSTLVPGVPTVLELNCGTGVDAVWMGQQGWQVLATDISTEMIHVAQAKIDQAQLSEQVSARVCAFADIGQLPENAFDLIFSNFGGLNCISPKEMADFWPVLLSKLKPGGQIIAVVMSRFCWWETLYFLLKRKPAAAFRRFQQKPVEARLNASTTVTTWYYSPRNLGFPNSTQGLRLRSFPVGFWLPPSYLDPFFAKWPRLLRVLYFLEKNATPSWFAAAADHFGIQVKKL